MELWRAEKQWYSSLYKMNICGNPSQHCIKMRLINLPFLRLYDRYFFMSLNIAGFPAYPRKWENWLLTEESREIADERGERGTVVNTALSSSMEML